MVTLNKNFSTIFAAICLLLLVLYTGVCLPSDAKSSTALGDILRLHVIANSDSCADQEIKLAVRDSVVETIEPLLYECKSIGEALRIALENKNVIEKTAADTLLANNSKMKARVVIGKEHYPERTYGGYVFPDGEYLSVRVILGEGRGKNWWCVLFPRLRGIGESRTESVVASETLDRDKAAELEKSCEKGSFEVFGCRIRFKLADLIMKGR